MKAPDRWSRISLLGALVLAVVLNAAAAQVDAKVAPIAVSRPARHAATLRLWAGSSRVNEGLNFDGQADGHLVITVPVGWRVVVHFENLAALPHSLVVEPWREPSDLRRPYAAFAGALTPDPYRGTASHGRVTFAFTAAVAGRYRLACAVPGHRDLGMWAVLVVSRTAKDAAARIVR